MPIFGYATVNEWNYISDGARIESSNYIIISGNENQRLLAFDFPPRSTPELPLPLSEAVPSLTPDTGSEDGELRTGSTSADPRAQMEQVGIWAKFKKVRERGKWGRSAKKEGEGKFQLVVWWELETQCKFAESKRINKVAQVVVKQQQGQAKQVAKRSYQAGQERSYQKESGDGEARLSKWCFLGNSSPAKRIIRWTGDSQRGYFPRSRLYFHAHPISRTFVFDWRDLGGQTEVYLCEKGGNVVKIPRGDPGVDGVRFTSLGEPLINIMGFEKTKLVSLIAGSVQADVVIDSLMGMNNFWQEYRYMADLSQAATDSTASPISEDGTGGLVLRGRSNYVDGDTYRDVITNNDPIVRFSSPQMPIDGARSRVESEPEPRMNVENSQEARLNTAKSVPRQQLPTSSIAIPTATQIPAQSPWPGVYGTVLSLDIDRNFSPNEEAIESYTPCTYDKFSSRPPASLYPCASRTTAASAKFDRDGNLVANQFRDFINSVNCSQQQSDHRRHDHHYHHRHNTTRPLQVVRGFTLPPDNPASVLDTDAQRRDFLARVGRVENWNMFPPIQVAPEYLPVVLRPLDWTGRVGDCNGLPDAILNGKVPPPPSTALIVRRIT